MLRNRHQPVNLFALVPQLGLRLDPQLEQLDRLLDDDELMELVRGDVARRHPKTRSRGVSGTSTGRRRGAPTGRHRAA